MKNPKVMVRGNKLMEVCMETKDQLLFMTGPNTKERLTSLKGYYSKWSFSGQVGVKSYGWHW